MPSLLEIETQITFREITRQTKHLLDRLRERFGELSSDGFKVHVRSDGDLYVADIAFADRVGALDIVDVQARIKILGELVAKGATVAFKADGGVERYYVGPSPEAIRENGDDSPFGENIGEDVVAKALGALLSRKPWTLAMGCYPDAGGRADSFLVEGSPSRACDLINEYLTVTYSEFDPECGVPDSGFDVHTYMDQRAMLLRLAACANKPELTAERLNSLCEGKRRS